VVDGIPNSLPAFLDEQERNAIRTALARRATPHDSVFGVTPPAALSMQRLDIK
jgi:hypothetical protein